MKFSPRPALLFLAANAAAWSLGGCQKPQIQVYLAPKDAPPPQETAATPATGPEAQARPKLSYQLPAGWEEAPPNSVSLASFKISSAGAEANVNITPLPNLAGRESMVVNMWRNQAGLAPIEDAELAKTLLPVEIGGKPGQMFEVLGAREGGAPVRIVTAFVHEPDASWFYKLQGEDALVAAQKPAFIEFLKTIRVEQATAPTAGDTPTNDAPKWSGPVPEGWQQVAPGNMQLAKFVVTQQDSAKADVSVSVFPNDTGGTLANVNRWRQQLALPAVEEAGLAEIVAPLHAETPGAMLVDLKNGPRALLGAIVPREGRWWFYKMMGDAAAVAGAREAFVSFAKTGTTE